MRRARRWSPPRIASSVLVALLAGTAPAAAAPPDPAPPAPPAPVGPRVTIESSLPNAGLYSLTTSHTTWMSHRGFATTGYTLEWALVCQAPCQQEVPPGEYAIRGDGIRSSALFQVPPGRAVQLDVTARAWAGAAGGGVALTVVGSVAMVAGAVLLGVGAKENVAPLGNPWFKSNAGRPYLIGGGAVLGSGVAMLISGVVLLARFRTTVAIDGKEVALKVPGTRLVLGPGGLRF